MLNTRLRRGAQLIGAWRLPGVGSSGLPVDERRSTLPRFVGVTPTR